MKVAISISVENKTVTVESERLLGSRLTGPIADDVFKLEAAGYKVIASQKIIAKLRKFKLSEAGVSHKRRTKC